MQQGSQESGSTISTKLGAVMHVLWTTDPASHWLADVALPAAMQAPTGPVSKGGKKGGKKGKGRKGKGGAAASAEDTVGADIPQAAPTAATEPLDVPGQSHLDTFDAGCGHLSDIMVYFVQDQSLMIYAPFTIWLTAAGDQSKMQASACTSWSACQDSSRHQTFSP